MAVNDFDRRIRRAAALGKSETKGVEFRLYAFGPGYGFKETPNLGVTWQCLNCS